MHMHLNFVIFIFVVPIDYANTFTTDFFPDLQYPYMIARSLANIDGALILICMLIAAKLYIVFYNKWVCTNYYIIH